MDVKLVLEKENGKSQTYRLRAKETVIGRMKGCNLRVPSESVSRRHCKLIVRDDYVTVEDLASVNGTFVNGQMIAKPTIVHPGDRLTIGSITFLVQYQLTPKGIEKLLEEQQKEMESLPTFDANDSSLPVIVVEEEESPPPTKKDKKPLTKKEKKSSKGKSNPGSVRKLDTERNPDASMVFDGRNWELPSRKDIREILTELDE
jgi:pSer/pThr/pTyr-binding forkhead associated (FHA) protein